MKDNSRKTTVRQLCSRLGNFFVTVIYIYIYTHESERRLWIFGTMTKEESNKRQIGKKRNKVQSSSDPLVYPFSFPRQWPSIEICDSSMDIALFGCPKQISGLTLGKLARAFDQTVGHTGQVVGSVSHVTRLGPVTDCSVHSPFGCCQASWVSSAHFRHWSWWSYDRAFRTRRFFVESRFGQIP